MKVMDIIKNLKDKSYNAHVGKRVYQMLYGAYKAGQFVFNPLYRSRVISVFKYSEAYHQFSNFTLPNRYPELFKIAQNHFKNHEKPRLLSFGCSTGEEIQSLKSYLPNSYCIGVDINAWCLEQAHKKYGQANVQFIHSLSKEFEAIGDFDAIFCLAVFQNPKNRHEKERKTSEYPFSQFEIQLRILDKKLKSGGLLFIDQYDFNFFETCLMPYYTIYPIAKNQILRDRPLFNKNNQKVAAQQNSFRIFQKK
jgi:tRNA G46 methylase TrmB